MCEVLMLLHLLRLSGYVEESGRMAWYTDLKAVIDQKNVPIFY